jgi:hypothetical protein
VGEKGLCVRKKWRRKCCTQELFVWWRGFGNTGVGEGEGGEERVDLTREKACQEKKTHTPQLFYVKRFFHNVSQKKKIFFVVKNTHNKKSQTVNCFFALSAKKI